jgi:hypothetical protein
MTRENEHEEMREVAREVLRELVPGILAEALGNAAPANGNGNSHQVPNGEVGEVVPVVPAPPVAAVLRPSTWTAPAAPGEVIGDAEPMSGHEASDASVEQVTIDTDEDLERFVRSLLSRLESPRDRRAIRTGRLRFALRRSSPRAPSGAAGSAAAPALRIAKGAVTERTVRDAAERGARLLLARGAVLTPLARDQARALGVTIEREGRC